MKLGAFSTLFFTLFAVSLFFSSPTYAQLWHALPAISETANKPEAQFSNDEKKVFFLNGTGGVENIWSAIIADKWGGIIAGPKNPPVQITKFTDHGVARFLHLLGSADLIYMRATENGKDYHIYRIADNGSGSPQDLTPGPEGITNIILGASYNGRYIYYSSNKINRDKTDVYQYDTQQNISENVFPNDKDYIALAWTRNQTKLLMQRPSTGALSIYDMETTDREPITPPNLDSVLEATLDPISQDILLLMRHSGSTVEYGRPFASGSWKQVPEDGADWFDFSPGAKYEILRYGNAWQVRDRASVTALPLPSGSIPLEFNSKETMLLYAMPANNGASQLYLYDISKKSSTLLTTVQ